MTRIEQTGELADDLERLRIGGLSERGFRAKYRSQPEDSVASIIWPYLAHFLSDADIRARDDDYRKMQEAEFAKLISLLRAGASDAELCRIHFLGYSGATNAA